MNRLYAAIWFCLCVGSSTYAAAQIRVDEEETTASVRTSNITVHTDPRLDLVVEKHRSGSGRGGIYSGRGYRIQIYYGNDRAQAIQRKIDFMRRFASIPTYMSYVQPQYRVKVGNFSSREAALELYRQCISLYGACMIVPDVVVINNASNNTQQDD